MLIFVAVGCAGPEDAELEQVGTGETSETGETGETGETDETDAGVQEPPPWPASLPPVEVDCPDYEFEPLQPVADTEDVDLLTCGELALDWGRRIMFPDGEVLEFGDRYITAQAPTGNLVAVGGSSPACSLVDLDSRSVREIAACDRHDFIPSFDVHAWGSWLYTCNEGTLEVHTPAASVLVDEGVNCNSIEMSRGSPILAYQVGTEVRIANADAATVVVLNSPAPITDNPCWDKLEVGYDGRFVAWDFYCPDGGFSRLFSTVDGSKVFERGPGWFAMSIYRRDAGWHLGDGAQLWTMAPTGGLHIADDVHIIVYAPHWKDRRWVQRQLGEASCELLRRSADGMGLDSFGTGPCVDNIDASETRDALVSIRSDRALLETWTADGGWAWPAPLEADSYWDRGQVLPDGTTVANEGSRRTVLVSPVGTIVHECSGIGIPIGEDRIAFICDEEAGESLQIVDTAGTPELLLVEPGQAERIRFSSYDGRVIAYGIDTGSEAITFYGALP